VTKKQIVQMISDKTGLTQLQTKDIVDLTFEAIVNTLLEEGRIELRNFGVFEVKQRKARKARNPRTGEKVDVPPKNVVTFKPGKEMEEKVRKLKKIPRPTAHHADDGVPAAPVKPAPNGAATRAAKPRKTT
jgi:integration host factor subunit beta